MLEKVEETCYFDEEHYYQKQLTMEGKADFISFTAFLFIFFVFFKIKLR